MRAANHKTCCTERAVNVRPGMPDQRTACAATKGKMSKEMHLQLSCSAQLTNTAVTKDQKEFIELGTLTQENLFHVSADEKIIKFGYRKCRTHA